MPFSLSLCLTEKLRSGAVPQVRGVDRPSILAISIRNVPWWAAAFFQDTSDLLSSALSGVGGIQSEMFPDGDDSAVEKQGIIALSPEVPQTLQKNRVHII